MLGALRDLTGSGLRERMRNYLTAGEIDGLLGRRDKIVALYEDKVRQQGEAQVLYDSPARPAVYPVGPREPAS